MIVSFNQKHQSLYQMPQMHNNVCGNAAHKYIYIPLKGWGSVFCPGQSLGLGPGDRWGLKVQLILYKIYNLFHKALP